MTESTAPRLTLPVSERDHVQGPSDAPVTLVEYGDYECPFCGAAHPEVKALQSRLGERLRFVFRNFPLTRMHPHAQQAAETAEAAGAQGKFWEMHDVLFERQDALERADLLAYAQELGLDVERLAGSLDASEFRARVREDFLSGAHSGVNGTPTFFINSQRYNGFPDAEGLLAAIEGTEPPDRD
jgi:protein-disulfide isomerase